MEKEKEPVGTIENPKVMSRTIIAFQNRECNVLHFELMKKEMQ